MTGTVLYNGTRSTTKTHTEPQTANAHTAPPQSLHLLHGLVAIENGPDYCLCGRTWPCESRSA